mmetsp:Transcript_1117/g.2267  ORF Transcript_1117/g.2267 Transcript_1117/m.2267 type:complete len:237 (+) Transcript_1117:73-783(+)
MMRIRNTFIHFDRSSSDSECTGLLRSHSDPCLAGRPGSSESSSEDQPGQPGPQAQKARCHDGTNSPKRLDNCHAKQAERQYILNPVAGHPELCVPCPSARDHGNCSCDDCIFCHKCGHMKQACLPTSLRRRAQKLGNDGVRVGIAAAMHRLSACNLWDMAAELRRVLCEIQDSLLASTLDDTEGRARLQQALERKSLRDILKWTKQFLKTEGQDAAIDAAACQLQQRMDLHRQRHL